ncbi:hypothetical protein CYY_000461 [Polysphondylium violaceum]|uniref:ATP-dependent RNA helicase n=1 Tax=Polysphondylium violaceum TaxID=133409 RepID=A0A8J4UX72_9MYCE|nr:hypothetical protein CYY_000461 [Polysphondylium violaceum]
MSSKPKQSQKKMNNDKSTKKNNNASNSNNSNNNNGKKDITKNKFDKGQEQLDKLNPVKAFHNRSSQKKKDREKAKDTRAKPLKLKIQEIEALEKRLKEEAPQRGTNPLANISSSTTDSNDKKEDKEYKIDYPSAILFKDLPLSHLTMKGLQESKFWKMTDIQRASLPHTLCGRDILGAAKTGSGKTLSFIIPILETLYRNRWGREDGIGAIVLSPTRELAIQIFDVLKAAGKHHNFSAGLIIGGRNVQQEKDKINSMNILIATPGRLLQHMDETYSFDCSNLKILVLDEADRILDLGFSKSLNSIVENLPSTRQTMLFSATQTKSIRDLARLSLNEPEYISVYEKDIVAVPQSLNQTVCVLPIDMKLNMLFSFIKSHLTSKTIVFFSSCKQVRFVYETFKLLTPGCSLFQLHGKMKQWTRLEVFESFCRKPAGTLFATDIAARGLDFPSVNWVIQVDCPDDIETYIHRVGRTARNQADGNSILITLPSEKEGMLALLEKQKMTYQVMEPHPDKLVSIESQLASFLSEKTELKYLAQKSFVSYLRSVHRQTNKDVFKVADLDIAAYSKSLGLIGTPQIQFGKSTTSVNKNTSFVVSGIKKKLAEQKEKGVEDQDSDIEDSDKDSEIEDSDGEIAIKQPLSKVEKLFKRKNANVLSDNYQKIVQQDQDSDDDMLVIKRRDHDLEDTTIPEKMSRTKSKEHRYINDPSRIKLEKYETVPVDGQLPTQYLDSVKEDLKSRDAQDKLVQKEKLKARKLAAQKREVRHTQGGEDDEEGEPVAYFVPPGEEDDQDQDDDEDYEDEDQDDEEEEEEEEKEPVNTKKRSISMQDQESLALELLRKKRGKTN